MSIDQDYTTNPWAQLKEFGANHLEGSQRVIVATGVARRATSGGAEPAVVALNVQRDLLVRDIDALLLLCLRPREWTHFATHAPDLADYATLRVRCKSGAPGARLTGYQSTPIAHFIPEAWPALLKEAWAAAGSSRLDEAKDCVSLYRLGDSSAASWEPLCRLILGTVACSEGRIKESERLLNDARSSNHDPATSILSTVSLASLKMELGNEEESLTLWRQARMAAHASGEKLLAQSIESPRVVPGPSEP